jgi:aspartyl-tRNA synthetase
MKRILNEEIINKVDQKVNVKGWVDSIRKHGKVVFVDLRDFSGISQIVFPLDKIKLAKEIRPEYVISVLGTVKKRPQGMENPKIKTGDFEIIAEELEILSKSKTLPFSIDGDGYEISEEKRLKYRYLDLRRERLKRNLKIRSEVVHFIRNFLKNEGFVEIETPILTKSTPEGARDFVVPSRLYPGKFYALPQSPQQYKQLLMVAGIERYFQIAKALRDEDPRSDRQPEHTQIDIEMAFASQEEILDLVQRLSLNLIKELFPDKKIKEIPFPRISYKEAMEKYQSDRPDLRDEKNNPSQLAFAFITDFPMFEWHKEEKRWGAMHHPFTQPQTNNLNEIRKSPQEILAYQYDFVLNGYEVGGGSLRNTDLESLLTVFEVLGNKRENIKKQFAHYFEAFSYGVPPHGGIAIGLDRLLSILLNEPNIREVIAFPKTGDSRDLMMDIPSEITKEQLEELHISIKKQKRIKKK